MSLQAQRDTAQYTTGGSQNLAISLILWWSCGCGPWYYGPGEGLRRQGATGERPSTRTSAYEILRPHLPV
jgi:hypothetical protein